MCQRDAVYVLVILQVLVVMEVDVFIVYISRQTDNSLYKDVFKIQTKRPSSTGGNVTSF